MSDWNSKIIEEFRANEGRVGGQFAGPRWCCCTREAHGRARSGSPP